MLLLGPIPLGFNLILEPRVSFYGAIRISRFISFAGIQTGRIGLSQFSMPNEGYGWTAAARTTVRVRSTVSGGLSLSWRDRVVSSNGRHSLRDANQAKYDKTQQSARHGYVPRSVPLS
jgi:hypothetical protein